MPVPDTPICDYEGSDYQASFWERGDREYEDRVEAIALKRLLPHRGSLLLEIGAGAGRNTARYHGYERIVLLDFSVSQLEQAQARLGALERYVYVAADAYRLPFVNGVFDGATMIRVLHHMADPVRALQQVWNVLGPAGVFILEFANKRNLKAILRYCLGRQTWSPFTQEAVEFAALNFDFHPQRVQAWLEEIGFRLERKLTVSHFRASLFKRLVPVSILVFLDSILQPTGALWQYTPSVFFRARGGVAASGQVAAAWDVRALFKCISCGHGGLSSTEGGLLCRHCGARWAVSNGIYDFRQPLAETAA